MRRYKHRMGSRRRIGNKNRRREEGLTTVETLIVQAVAAGVVFGLVALLVRTGWLEDVPSMLSAGPRSAGELWDMVQALWQ